MRARARPDTSVSARMNTAIAMADFTPMSRTRAARRPNSSASWTGRPKSFTSVAPGAEKRSVIWVVMAALCIAASRSRMPTRAPMRRAGMTKIGSSTMASSVICHDRLAITPTVSTSTITLVTTPDSAEVNARWAPITSLLSRLTRAPVWVRVKKAIGIDCTCSNTRRRRSRMRFSPSWLDVQRSSRPTAASARATSGDEHGQADRRRRWSSPSTMALTAGPARIGVATPSTAEVVARIRKMVIRRRCGAAKSSDAPPGVALHRPPGLAGLHGAAQHVPRVHVAHGMQARSSSSL